MGFVLALISSAAFGLIPLFSLPLLHSGLSADCVLFYRFLFASISLGLILVLRQERFAAPARDLGLLALFSVLYALAALLMIWGLLYLSGGVTATLQFLYPLMVMLIMTIFFHEKFSIITASSVLLAILGVALLGSGGGDDGGSLDPLGVGLLLAALCNALYISGLHVARIHSISGLSITFWVLFFGTGVSLVNALISGTFEIIGTWEQLALSLLLAIITAVISNLTLILAIQRIGSTLASILGVGEPLTAVTVGILVFDEPATFAVFSGVAVICAAVVLAADPGLAAEKKAWGVDTRGRRPSLWTPLPLAPLLPAQTFFSGSVAVLMARKPVSC